MLLFLLNIFSLFFQSADKLNDDIDRYLAMELSGYERIEFTIVKIPADYKKIEIMENSHLNLTGNTAYIPIKLTNKANKTNQTFLTVNVKLFKTVLTAKEQIDRKKELSDSDFEVKQADVAGLRGKIFPINEAIRNYRAKNQIRKNEVLTFDFLERIPVIKAGDKVKAYFIQSTVSVDFYVISKQDGIEGDIIRVVTPENKQYKAKIVDSRNVIISE